MWLYYYKIRLQEAFCMRCFGFIALLLVVIGALNWGLIGFFQYDLISDIFGGMDASAARIVYGIVGLAGIYCISLLCHCCCCKCGPKCSCKKK